MISCHFPFNPTVAGKVENQKLFYGIGLSNNCPSFATPMHQNKPKCL